MSKAKTTPKKIIRKQIAQQLLATFDHLKADADPKRLKRSIRKASKVLSDGIKPQRADKKIKNAKPTKKASKKPTPPSS